MRELAGENGSAWVLTNLRQIHSDVIYRVDDPAKKLAPGDGMITPMPRVLLAIRTADCLPILIADPKHKAVGAFHAGWRGTLARIAEKGVGAMRREFGSQPSSLVAAIGPGIHACCYSVGAEVREQFESQFDYAAELFREVHDVDAVRKKYPLMFMNQRAPGHGDTGPELHLDLVEANRRQLLAAGLRAENVEALDLCTSCRTDLLFSHRAEHGKTGRMFGAIGII
jgi:YfiH family protein